MPTSESPNIFNIGFFERYMANKMSEILRRVLGHRAPCLWVIILSMPAFVFWDLAIGFGLVYFLERIHPWDTLDPMTFQEMKKLPHGIILSLTWGFTVWRIILWSFRAKSALSKKIAREKTPPTRKAARNKPPRHEKVVGERDPQPKDIRPQTELQNATLFYVIMPIYIMLHYYLSGPVPYHGPGFVVEDTGTSTGSIDQMNSGSDDRMPDDLVKCSDPQATHETNQETTLRRSNNKKMKTQASPTFSLEYIASYVGVDLSRLYHLTTKSSGTYEPRTLPFTFPEEQRLDPPNAHRSYNEGYWPDTETQRKSHHEEKRKHRRLLPPPSVPLLDPSKNVQNPNECSSIASPPEESPPPPLSHDPFSATRLPATLALHDLQSSPESCSSALQNTPDSPKMSPTDGSTDGAQCHEPTRKRPSPVTDFKIEEASDLPTKVRKVCAEG